MSATYFEMNQKISRMDDWVEEWINEQIHVKKKRAKC